MDYYLEEIEITKKLFDLDKILAFQLENDVQIIRGEDWMYMAYISKQVYSTALTPMGALVFGIAKYEELKTTKQIRMKEDWIKVQDQLPPIGSTVLTYPHFKVLPFGNTPEEGLEYNETDKKFWEWDEYPKVANPYPTHWMALPPSPNQKEGELK